MQEKKLTSKLALIGFVFLATKNGFISIILLQIIAYANLSFREIGFVLHKIRPICKGFSTIVDKLGGMFKRKLGVDFAMILLSLPLGILWTALHYLSSDSLLPWLPGLPILSPVSFFVFF